MKIYIIKIFQRKMMRIIFLKVSTYKSAPTFGSPCPTNLVRKISTGWQLNTAILAAIDPVTKCVIVLAVGEDIVLGKTSPNCFVTLSNAYIYDN
jgi:hypothetical protein